METILNLSLQNDPSHQNHPYARMPSEISFRINESYLIDNWILNL